MSGFSDETFEHVPVMLGDVVELFSTVPPGLIVDGTLGGAGHASAILDSRADVRLLGIDRDAAALEVARQRLARFGDRVAFHHGRFDQMAEAVRGLGEDHVSGVLLDLGVSSPQLDHADRGFSYRLEAPLDMRMDTSQTLTAHDVVNDYTAEQLSEVLHRYGDERFHRRIAKQIVNARPIETTTQLSEVVASAIPAPARRRGGNPVNRSFQAIRIEVNDELAALSNALDQALDLLLPGGRCVVLSYHSGEDRIVKDRFRRAETGGCECPQGLECVCGAEPQARLIKRGAQKASAEEIDENPRAASVRRRVVESVRFTERPQEVA
ncbi:MAG: 16S rRNA (cytosine(1402)-N(4))-methyltransferase RsmH [Microthrixaceae bacterium]|nr:16S rRNA (cytosine(1402)-N(4))-methyltransferase RsmH [Microthrixaceae bacterium]MCO5312600.1 16S rRNA (cytosine(1402)-N(4))-methyltransferase RsmH [Microthrixaceae bacterium]